jgi:8-amino-7-oxononanoate synthase
MNDIFDRRASFRRAIEAAERRRIVSTQYRLTLTGPLDRQITVLDPRTSAPRTMLCFDSNSYLGLHLDPRVIEATRRALAEVGYGTPSAQLLSGTNRWLRALEDTVAAFHGREAALVFPSGYAANVGVLTALLRPGDAVARDRFCHASIHDGIRYARVRGGGAYAHRDAAGAERVLEASPEGARLVATDGVFSMHGTLAPLPELRRVASARGARLLVDDAHGVGVLGPRGRGIEDHFGLRGAADVLVGTFSKAPGTTGGYVAGRRDLIDYLRFHAHASVFTAAVPAATCAGLVEAFRVMEAEPEPRERLWTNARRFHAGARELGLTSSPLESPIVPIFAGSDERLFELCLSLYDDGVKCGSVRAPAVPRGEAVLRFSMNARHTEEDVDRALDALDRAARRSKRGDRPTAIVQEVA